MDEQPSIEIKCIGMHYPEKKRAVQRFKDYEGDDIFEKLRIIQDSENPFDTQALAWVFEPFTRNNIIGYVPRCDQTDLCQWCDEHGYDLVFDLVSVRWLDRENGILSSMILKAMVRAVG